MKKNAFLEFLSNSTKRDLNKVIKEKGKQPKLINCIIFLDNKNDNRKLLIKQENN